MYEQRVSLESWSRTQKGKAGSVSSVHRIATSLPCVHCAQTPQSHATRWAGASNPSCCSAPARDPFRLFTPLPQGFGGDDTVKPRRRGARSTEHGARSTGSVGHGLAAAEERTSCYLPLPSLVRSRLVAARVNGSRCAAGRAPGSPSPHPVRVLPRRVHHVEFLSRAAVVAFGSRAGVPADPDRSTVKTYGDRVAHLLPPCGTW
jgi:hypothetical protein